MSDMKSKIPDLKELASMTGKLYKDIKTSVGQIIQDYKDVRAQSGIDGDNTEEVKKAEKPKAEEESKTEDDKK
mgnify:CR=1 FL=1